MLVSFTVKDSAGNVWANSSYSALFVPGQTAPSLSTGESVAAVSGVLDSTGSASNVVVGDTSILGGGCQWLFTITAPSGQSFSVYTRPTAANSSLSSAISAEAPLLSSSSLNSLTLAAASQATYRLGDDELLLNFQGSVTISGSVAARRGCATIAAGTTIAGGFVYGVQGKLIAKGTIADGSGFNCGVLAQLDLSAITAHSSGYLAPLICDVGASVAGTLATDSNLNGIFISNNTACKMNAAIKANIKATYVFDLSDSQNDYSWLVNTAAASISKYLVVNVGGTLYKIPLYATA